MANAENDLAQALSSAFFDIVGLPLDDLAQTLAKMFADQAATSPVEMTADSAHRSALRVLGDAEKQTDPALAEASVTIAYGYMALAKAL